MKIPPPLSGIIASSLCTSDEPIRAVLTSERPNRRACPRQVSCQVEAMHHPYYQAIHRIGNVVECCTRVFLLDDGTKYTYIPRVLQCLSPRPYWELGPITPISRKRVPPPGTTGGGHTRLRVRGWGSPNSDVWRKSLAFCLLYGKMSQIRGFPKVLCGGEGYLQRCVGI